MSETSKHSREELRQMQSLPLSNKVAMAKRRITEWYDYWNGAVYVSFSGGKDSAVLLHLVRTLYPDVEAVYCDLGLEHPSLRAMARETENCTIIHPKRNFRQVIEQFGYPVISKEVASTVYWAKTGSATSRARLDDTRLDKHGSVSKFNLKKYQYLMDAPFNISGSCCRVMKKAPFASFEHKSGKHPFLGTLAGESQMRLGKWLQHGCNLIDGKRPVSNPLSFWTDQDILLYASLNTIKLAEAYGTIEPCIADVAYADQYPESVPRLRTTGASRTGCQFCAFGAHMESSPNRFEMLKQTDHDRYAYLIGGGEFRKEDGKWVPNNYGLGMGFVLDWLKIKY